ncbi:MAG: endonuclease III [Desulfobacteraceae bacterium]|nr:MAG: endonuclease III [Desulfobacteraceae bacterium]
MKNNTRIRKIRQILRESYPDVKTQLYHNSAFELLMATILSAQCTDRQVNSVTPELFRELPTAEAFAEAPLKKIEKLIYSTGFYRNKARNLKQCATALIRDHQGNVPSGLEELVRLPGVGRKTANVVRGAAFQIPSIVVDTHVARISQRLGLTTHQDPTRIEFDLMEVIPEKEWNDFSLLLIYFGRATCTARKPACGICNLNSLCPFPDKTV